MNQENIIGTVIEGQSYVGKTTTLEAIKNMLDFGVIVVPEYTMFGKLPDFPSKTREDLKKTIQIILDLEKRRTEFLSKQLDQNPDAPVFFDRGPISCIAFQHAAENNGYSGACLWLADTFQREFLDKNIFVPNGMVHFTASGEIIRERERKDLNSGKGNIMSFLKEEGVITSINEVFSGYGTKIPEELFLTLVTDFKTPDDIAIEVLQFVKNQQINSPKVNIDFSDFAKGISELN